MATWPTKGYKRVSNPFGRPNKRYRLGVHLGSDLSAPVGTPILAAVNGNVIYTPDRKDGYGNTVSLKIGNGDVLYHAHLSKGGKTGKVKEGEVIGYVGMTGMTDGPHCHLEVRRGGKFPMALSDLIDFEKWFKSQNASKPKPAPKPAPKAPVKLTAQYLVVGRGEGLSHLAHKAGYKDWTSPARWQAIAKLNKSPSWNAFNRQLSVGQKIRVR